MMQEIWFGLIQKVKWLKKNSSIKMVYGLCVCFICTIMKKKGHMYLKFMICETIFNVLQPLIDVYSCFHGFIYFIYLID